MDNDAEYERLRSLIKDFESKFFAANGHKPQAQDIKNGSSDVRKLYKQYMLLKREKGLNASSSSFSSPPRKLSVASTVSLDDSVLHTPTDEGEMSNLRMKNEEMALQLNQIKFQLQLSMVENQSIKKDLEDLEKTWRERWESSTEEKIREQQRNDDVVSELTDNLKMHIQHEDRQELSIKQLEKDLELTKTKLSDMTLERDRLKILLVQANELNASTSDKLIASDSRRVELERQLYEIRQSQKQSRTDGGASDDTLVNLDREHGSQWLTYECERCGIEPENREKVKGMLEKEALEAQQKCKLLSAQY